MTERERQQNDSLVDGYKVVTAVFPQPERVIAKLIDQVLTQVSPPSLPLGHPESAGTHAQAHARTRTHARTNTH